MNFSDDFNRAVLGANWSLTGNDIGDFTDAQIVSARVRAGAAGGDGAIEIQNPLVGGVNQWAKITVPTLDTGGLVRVVLRGQVNVGTGYVLEVGKNAFALYKLTPERLDFPGGALPDFVPGSEVMFSVTGQFLRGYIAGELIVEDTDDELLSGQPGFGIAATTSVAEAEISAFSSGLNENRMYPTAMRDFTLGAYSWMTTPFKAMLVNTGYVFDVSHEFVSSASAYEVTGTGYVGGFGGAGRLDLTNPNNFIDAGIQKLFADPLLWAQLDVGTIGALLLLHEVSADSDSPLIAFINSGFPYLTFNEGLQINLPSDLYIRAHDIRVTP